MHVSSSANHIEKNKDCIKQKAFVVKIYEIFSLNSKQP